jgi:hypothetical protein
LPDELTLFIWPTPGMSGWRGDGAGARGDRVALVGPKGPDPAGDVAAGLEGRSDGVPPGGEVRKVGLARLGVGVAGPLGGRPSAFSQLSRATYAAVPSAPRETTMAAMAASIFCRSFSLLSHPLSWLWSCSSCGLVSGRLSDIDCRHSFAVN